MSRKELVNEHKMVDKNEKSPTLNPSMILLCGNGNKIESNLTFSGKNRGRLVAKKGRILFDLCHKPHELMSNVSKLKWPKCRVRSFPESDDDNVNILSLSL